MGITKNQIDAINDILKMVEPWIDKVPGEIDSTEPISILAILAGSFLFRSFEFKLDNVTPGTTINIHSEVEQTKEKQLIIITHSILELHDIKTDINMLPHQYIKQRKNYFIDVISKVQEPALQIMKKHSLTYEQMAQSLALATTYFIQQGENITIEEKLKTAMYYYIVGSRTYPPDFAEKVLSKKLENENINDANLSEQELKPWWKFW